jgi:hypothetical protein
MELVVNGNKVSVIKKTQLPHGPGRHFLKWFWEVAMCLKLNEVNLLVFLPIILKRKKYRLDSTI